MLGPKVFHRTWLLQQLPVTLKLNSIDWRFMICADGKTTVAQIQRTLQISEQEADAIVSRLSDMNLVTETRLTLDEFAKTTLDNTVTNTEPQTFEDYLRTSELSDASKEKSLPSFSPLQKPAMPTPTTRSMSLQSVIKFILSQNSDSTAGQLATYQIFMGINPQLLKRNGITSLRFQDDRLITDVELQKAITDNIQKVLNVSCPKDVYRN